MVLKWRNIEHLLCKFESQDPGQSVEIEMTLTSWKIHLENIEELGVYAL